MQTAVFPVAPSDRIFAALLVSCSGHRFPPDSKLHINLVTYYLPATCPQPAVGSKLPKGPVPSVPTAQSPAEHSGYVLNE